MALDATLLTFTLLIPSPFRHFVYEIQIQLRFGNFPYFFVIFVGIVSFTYTPRFVIWGGAICALAWLELQMSICEGSARPYYGFGQPAVSCTSRRDHHRYETMRE